MMIQAKNHMSISLNSNPPTLNIMKIKTNWTASLLAIVLLSGCAADTSEKTYAVIPVADAIGVEVKELDSKDISFVNSTVIPLELTDESMLGRVRVTNEGDGKLVMNSGEVIFFFDAKTGKHLSSISRKGRGSSEYLYCHNAIVNYDKNKVYVLDNGKISSYTFDGDYVKTVKNDSISSFATLNDDVYVAYNNPQSDHVYNYSLYDSDWNYIKGYDKYKEEAGANPHYINVLGCEIFNDKLYTYKDNSFYEITENEFKQALFLDKGAYSIPASVLGDMSKKTERMKYVWGDYGRIAGDYLLYDYVYNNKKHYDIWNISKGELVYRTTASGRGDKIGFPVNHNGTTVYMWPQYVQDNALYGILSADDVEKLGIENNDNPVVMRVEIQ